MTATTPLNGPVHPPASGQKPKQLIVLFHGLGADGEDLIGLAPMLAPLFPDAQFISPNAPFPCDMSPFGYQWFSLQNWSPEAIEAGLDHVAPTVNRFIDDQLAELGLSEDKLAYIGFSQGTMLSLHVALRRANPCAGIVGFSGLLAGAQRLETERVSKPPVCLIHGEADMVVPFDALAAAETALKAVDVPVETHARPHLGHGIDPEGMELAAAFLQQKLD